MHTSYQHYSISIQDSKKTYAQLASDFKTSPEKILYTAGASTGVKGTEATQDSELKAENFTFDQ